MPKISVLFPTYNTKEEYLREAIESVLNQTFSDFEFIVLDDCSPDPNVEKVVKSYTDPRIRFYRNERNLGISQTRNKLIDLASGEYLAVMDHDDVSLPERFEKEAAYLDAYSPLKVLARGYSVVTKEGQVISSSAKLRKEDEILVRFAKGGAVCRVEQVKRKC